MSSISSSRSVYQTVAIPVGYEIILLYLAGLAALVLGGPGPLSIDHWRASRRGRSFATAAP